ncbi:RcnB family protein [Caenimonas aquaedulcis]|uniref:RcnB family protein n=1 Tax=Caenimonas aquaedulcis TaxID=2793270 RepID=A0A931H373_9BURK|nr:RcnB family protein [Caenimonas aquaedulcis]MBG9387774.1 RcnB family protein [Caenimonas aquaedulcis]
MKSTVIASTVFAAAALGFSSLALAQDHGRADRHEHRGQAQRQWQQPQHQQPQYRQPQYQQRQYQPQYQHPQYQQRSYAPQAQWRGQWAGHGSYRRGDVLPWQYRQRAYYVNDWRERQLYAPPYGYQWVRDDAGDYLLVALATGIIANLLINSY